MALASRVAFLSLLVLIARAADAQAQVTLGGALVVARTTAGPDEAGTFSPPPSGTELGVVAFLGTSLNARIGLQAEISVPHRTSTTNTSSHPGGGFTDTTVHRDVVFSGLLRLRASSWCNLLAGAGVVVASTSATSVFIHSGGSSATEKTLPDTTRLALTAGGDFPVRIARHVWLLPTVRIHYLSRAELEPPPGIDNRPIGRPGRVAIRAGAGVMLGF